MASDGFCAEASIAVGEPLAGSAAETSHWIVLEHAGAWGVKGLEDSGLADEVVSTLRQLGKLQPGLRVQLIRRGEGRSSGDTSRPKLFIADAREGKATLFELVLPGPADWGSLGLEGWLSHGTPPASAVARTEPLYLVCVHGKRDRCCALKGLPVYNALRAQGAEQVFQTTHLGGHRFAATLVVLPEGICYGRVTEQDAPGLRSAHEKGEIYALSKVRGRMSYGGFAQAAEVAIRERLSERRIRALAWVRKVSEGEVERVTFVHTETGAEHTAEITRAVFAAAPASCGAEAQPVKGLVQLGKGPA